MDNYLSIVPISAKIRKEQSRMTRVCISTAVFLVTGIFSTVDVMIKQEKLRLAEKNGEEELAAFLQRQSVRSLYPIAIVLFLFVLIAGSLMIAGSMNSNVTQRTKFFGMMRCIGMSKKQVRRMVRLEALNWCRTAVPVGVLLGTAAQWILCAVLKYVIGGEFSEIPQFSISIIGIISGVLVGLTTVLLAAQKPAKRASSVPPITAVNGMTEQIGVQSIMSRIESLKVETGLGLSYATSSVKNLLLVASSIALTIILFFSFSVITDLVGYIMPQSALKEDFEIASENAGNTIDYDLSKELSALDGVKHVYARRSVFDVPCSTVQNENITCVDIISFDSHDIECLKKDGLLRKNADMSSVFGDRNCALVISDTEFDKGAVIDACGEQIKSAGMLKYDPFSSDGSTENRTTLIVSDETFVRLTGVRDYALLMVELDNDASDETVADIIRLADGKGDVRDVREYDTHGTYLAFMCCTYAFLVIIGMVAVLNIVNCITMGVSARMMQYGTMRAVGMEFGQLLRMIAAEAGAYTAAGLALGLTIGLIFSKWLYGYLVTSHFPFAHWSLPVVRIIIVAFFTLSAFAAGVLIPSKRIRNMSVTETINRL